MSGCRRERMLRPMRMRSVILLVLSSGALPATAVAQKPAQSMVSCNQTLGRARAQRLVNQCLHTTTATRPPCNAANDCATIGEHVKFMCENNLGAQAPAYCGEGDGLSDLSELGVGERYAKTVTLELRNIKRQHAALQKLRAELEPLSTSGKASEAALKKSRAEFDKALQRAKAGYDKYVAKAAKPTTADLDALRRDLSVELEAVVKHGAQLGKDAEALTATQTKLLQTSADASLAKTSIQDQLRDMKEAKQLLDAGVTKLTADAKKQPALANDAARLKVIAAQSADKLKEATPLGTDADKLAKGVAQLAQATPAGNAARTAAFKAAKKTEQDALKAASMRRTIDDAQKAADARRSPRAPSARKAGCELERVDFKNFSYAYPDAPDSPPSVFKDGREEGMEDGGYQISDVKLVDLDGSGKKEAVVFIEGPPSAHSGPQNQLIFLQLDEQCRVQTLKRLWGGVTPGAMKGKSYFYGDTVLMTPEGMAGTFAAGTETVELRYLNGELKELSRKEDR